MDINARLARRLTQLRDEYGLSIRELADRLDGKPVQVVDRRDAAIEELSDAELHLIAMGGLPRSQQPEVLLIPPPSKDKAEL